LECEEEIFDQIAGRFGHCRASTHVVELRHNIDCADVASLTS
jgi:hypothetical protein